MRRSLRCALAPLLLLPCLTASSSEIGVDRGSLIETAHQIGTRGGTALYRKELVSQVYTIDRIYKSMQGPASSIEFAIDTDGESELLWVVGYSARMMNADETASMSNEFMCHSNMGLRGNTYHQTFPTELRVKGQRLFALDQGTLEIEFPEPEEKAS